MKTTLTITFFAVLLGTLLGGCICWMRMNRTKDVEISVPRFIGTEILEGEDYALQTAILNGMCRDVNVSRDGQSTKLHCVLM